MFYVLRLLFEINPPGWSPYQFFSIDRSVRENERAGRAKTRPASFVPEHGPVLGKEQKSVPELGALFLVPTLRVHVLGQKSGIDVRRPPFSDKVLENADHRLVI